MIILDDSNYSVFFVVVIPKVYSLSNRVFPAGFFYKCFIYQDRVAESDGKSDEKFLPVTKRIFNVGKKDSSTVS